MEVKGELGRVLPFGQEGQFPEAAEAKSGALALQLPEPRLPLPKLQGQCPLAGEVFFTQLPWHRKSRPPLGLT